MRDKNVNPFSCLIFWNPKFYHLPTANYVPTYGLFAELLSTDDQSNKAGKFITTEYNSG